MDSTDTHRHGVHALLVALALFLSPWVASSETIAMNVDNDQVKQWNRFVDSLLALHQKTIAQHKVQEEEKTGRYGGEYAKQYTYREVSYRDTKSGRLLSRIRRNDKEPEKIEIIDVYVYDTDGRVARDYTALFLPWARNAPSHTYINLHQYRDGLHGYRQFDASGYRLYEQCQGTFSGESVNIDLEDHKITEAITQKKSYQACFGDLPQTAENYLIPN